MPTRAGWSSARRGRRRPIRSKAWSSIASAVLVPAPGLYDRAGSELFERITEPFEYFTRTRTEVLISAVRGRDRRAAGRRACVVELGSGFEPRDAAAALGARRSGRLRAGGRLRRAPARRRWRCGCSSLAMHPVVADFNRLRGSVPADAAARRSPSSPARRSATTRRPRRSNRCAASRAWSGRRHARARRRRDAGPSLLPLAYDDPEGADRGPRQEPAAAHELRTRRRLTSTASPRGPPGHAPAGVEMNLVSRREQWVRVAGERLPLRPGRVDPHPERLQVRRAASSRWSRAPAGRSASCGPTRTRATACTQFERTA